MANEPFSIDSNIINQLGLNDLPEEQRLAMVARMSDLVLKRVMLRLLENLPESDTARVQELADKPDELMALLGERFDIGAIVQQETEALRNELVAEAVTGEAEQA
ncbi:MAG: hypothetical protein PHT12_01835 [Patescibacteria group bacterium]|nr:hypothetical protein [Patescibacteria group bacterium]